MYRYSHSHYVQYGMWGTVQYGTGTTWKFARVMQRVLLFPPWFHAIH